jgi:hypothetical protein
MPEHTYSKVTTMQQGWVREAFGDRVISDIPDVVEAPKAKASPPVRRAGRGRPDRLAAELGDLLQHGHQDFLQSRLSDLTAVLEALKIRREATAPARRRIGEYLRHVAINEVAYERTKDSAYSNAKAPRDIVDEIRADAYAATARLRLTDLSQVVEPTVRDSQREFYAQQATIQSGLDTDKLPEKQAALVPCVARGHITSHGDGRYSGERGCTCHLLDGRTMNALVKRDFIGIRQGLGYRANGTLMLIRPKTA